MPRRLLCLNHFIVVFRTVRVQSIKAYARHITQMISAITNLDAIRCINMHLTVDFSYKSRGYSESKTVQNQAPINMKSLILLILSASLASGQTDCPNEDYVQGEISGICYRFTDVAPKVSKGIVSYVIVRPL